MLDGTTNYTYDNDGQLLGATGSQPAASYQYDANGNRTSTGYVTGADNLLLSDGTFNYTYDANGNCTSKTRISQTPADDYTTIYTWDYRNELTGVTTENNAGQVTQQVAYAYDAFGRLVGKVVSVPGQADQKTAFVYDGEQIALQFDGSGASDLAASNLSHRYLSGPAIDQILADEQVTTPGQAGNVVWPLADNLGTVRDLAQYNAATGVTTIANHRVYDSYGNLTSQTNAAVDSLFGYTGQVFDKDTGLCYYRARWYDPSAGRFLSQDPIAFSSGDTNLDRYASNSPTNFTDPSGLCHATPNPSNSKAGEPGLGLGKVTGISPRYDDPAQAIAAAINHVFWPVSPPPPPYVPYVPPYEPPSIGPYDPNSYGAWLTQREAIWHDLGSTPNPYKPQPGAGSMARQLQDAADIRNNVRTVTVPIGGGGR